MRFVNEKDGIWEQLKPHGSKVFQRRENGNFLLTWPMLARAEDLKHPRSTVVMGLFCSLLDFYNFESLTTKR